MYFVMIDFGTQVNSLFIVYRFIYCWQVFEQVTILFSDVVGFTRICSQITPMDVVSMLNSMYTKFDQLSEKHRVYKVSVCVCVRGGGGNVVGIM